MFGKLHDDHAVGVAVDDLARIERDTADFDRNVLLPGARLGALAGIGAECLHTDVESPQNRRVPDGTVDDDPRPSRWRLPCLR